jgi:hypothetical protein
MVRLKMTTGKFKRQQYFKTWTSYSIPMRPAGPISYAETKALRAYYLAFYDHDDNLARFVKYYREPQPAGGITLGRAYEPSTVLFFEAALEWDKQPAVGKEIDFLSTEKLSPYYQGVVEKDGRFAQLSLITTTVLFADDYQYWPNKQLKERVMHKEDGTTTRHLYDKSGKELPAARTEGTKDSA